MTNAVKITVHAAGTGHCALTGKETDGLTVTFDDGTVTHQHVSWKSFRQLLALRTAQQAAKPAVRPTVPTTPALATVPAAVTPAGNNTR